MQGAAEQSLADAEAALGRRLPGWLRDHLAQFNGGELEALDYPSDDRLWTLIPVWDPSTKETARRTASHMLSETPQARTWPGFPTGAVCIADNGTGDKLILLGDSDEAHWWDHETGNVAPTRIRLPEPNRGRGAPSR